LKKNLRVTNEAWDNVLKLEMVAPLLKLLAIEGAEQSHHEAVQFHDIKTYYVDNKCLKRYEYSAFTTHNSMHQDFNTEYQIMKKAKESDLKRIIHLD